MCAAAAAAEELWRQRRKSMVDLNRRKRLRPDDTCRRRCSNSLYEEEAWESNPRSNTLSNLTVFCQQRRPTSICVNREEDALEQLRSFSVKIPFFFFNKKRKCLWFVVTRIRRRHHLRLPPTPYGARNWQFVIIALLQRALDCCCACVTDPGEERAKGSWFWILPSPAHHFWSLNRASRKEEMLLLIIASGW